MPSMGGFFLISSQKTKNWRLWVWLILLAAAGAIVLALLLARVDFALFALTGWKRSALKNFFFVFIILLLLTPYLKRGIEAVLRQLTNKTRLWMNWLLCAAVTLLIPLALTLCAEMASQGNSAFSWFISPEFRNSLIRGWVFLVLLFALFLFLFNAWSATLVTGILSVVLGTANHLKIVQRTEPVYPWDLQALTTFFDVAEGNYFDIDIYIAFSIAIWLSLIVLCIPLHLPIRWWRSRAAFGDSEPSSDNSQKSNPAKALSSVSSFLWRFPQVIRAFSLVVVAALFLGYTNEYFLGDHALKPTTWDPHIEYSNRGVVTSFMTELQTMNPAAPEGYSQQAVQEIMDRYDVVSTAADADLSPNIIMIMSEAFFDIESLHPGITYETELLPNLRRLQNESIHGDLYVNAYGGGTCQTEFETLTGFNTSFLSQGVIAFNNIINTPYFSTADFLGTEGYLTVGGHPASGTNWSRARVYPLLGFEESFFIEDFAAEPGFTTNNRSFMYDQALMEHIIRDYENNRELGEPQFQFAVTMQNHSPHTYDAFPDDFYIDCTIPEGYDIDEENLIVCASGLHHSDAALGYLIDYFNNIDDPTIIIFYGDHQNPLGEEVRDFNVWRTPFIVWSNYSTDAKDMETVAAYHLSPILFEEYDLPMPGYYQFLNQLRDICPGFSSGQVLEPDGSLRSDLTAEEQQALADFEMIQYDYIYGKKYASAWFE